jgi:hypothetical protein
LNRPDYAQFEVLGTDSLAAGQARAVDLSYTALGGYQMGGALRVMATAKDVFQRAPIAFAFGLGFPAVDSGDPALARRVFINDNTDGTPEKSGTVWDLRLGAIYLLEVRKFEELGIYVGLRRSMFSGNFRYVGGNEDFTVTSNAWGYGVGVRAAFTISGAWSLAMQAGLDHFPVTSLYGHDATYSSNAPPVNPRENFTYADADRAVNHPKLVPSVLVGVTWRP